ncbi:CPBP family intramembrane glutamic endopeptidase [Rhodocaloribacter sp.]
MTEEMSTHRRVWYSLVILAVFVVVVFAGGHITSVLFPGVKGYHHWLLRIAIDSALCLLATMALYKTGLLDALRALRIVAPVLGPVLMAIVATLPMPILFSFTGSFSAEFDPLRLFFSAGIAPFEEELIYRGFGFWLLYRLANWGFWPSALLPAVFFSWGHVAQASSLGGAIGIVALTAAGSIWFSWLLLRWNSLWAPVAMHALMNGWWEVFEVDTTALGGRLANVARFATIGLAIAITLRRDRLLNLLGRRRTDRL